MESKKEIISYLNNISVLLLGLLFLAFPILVTTITTDFFVTPKQILLGGVVLVSLFIFGLSTIIEGSVRLRRTIFDLPIILFILSVFLSAVFAVNRFDSLIASVPFLFVVLVFFIIVNVVRNKNSLLFLIASLVLGGALVSTISVLSFFKIYLLPFEITHTQTFTPLGSLLDQAIYLALLLPTPIVIAIRELTKRQSQTNSIAASDAERGSHNKNIAKAIAFIIASITILIGLLVTIYQLFNPSAGGQRPIILPFDTGFQTAFAAISQDTQRLVQTFLFGSGFGTYVTDFTRFKQVAFNQNQTLWSLTFLRSSSFILELLATTGILGFLSFAFLIVKTVNAIIGRIASEINSISLSLLLSITALFVLPIGFTIQTIFFILLALYAALQGLKNTDHKKFFEVELHLVAFRKGLIALQSSPFAINDPYNAVNYVQNDKKSRLLPLIFSLIIVIIGGFLGFFSISYLISDIEFQNSLISASNNNGEETYQKQLQAISTFPYKDTYYRVFSQTNLGIANSLSLQQPKNASPSAKTQETIYRLIQQSINAGRTATTIAPQTALNWQNLSSIYRSLIGFGQNAEDFTIATQQQAVLLDPNNPNTHIILGGIFYQLGLWDNAQNQFQVAVNLKPDFANAHYNLGHVLENKGDLANALMQFKIVQELVANDKNSLSQINKEVGDLQKKIQEKGSSEKSPATTTSGPPAQPPLNLSTPSAQLPPQNPPVKIPPPTSATQSGR